MARQRHIVLTGAALPDFISYVEDQAVASIIVVCSAKQAFMDQLLAACLESPKLTPDPATDPHHTESTPTGTHRLLQQPSLRMLASSQRIKLAFCPDVVHLRAYLSTFKASREDENLLAILNPVELHRPTSAFSAQGLNRTFSLAVEAALRAGSRLLIGECASPGRNTPQTVMETGVAAAGAALDEAPPLATSDPWEEEVSILNVTTKSFSAGGRGWVGRTVKIRRVAGRWCTFEPYHPPAVSP